MSTPSKPREFWLVKAEPESICHYVLYLPPLPPKHEVVHVIEKSAFDKAVHALKHYAIANGGTHPSGNVARNTLRELGVELWL